ncbi:MAG: hypothetical protein WAM42_03745 [Candidatus Nitrosopolaris sp.]
MIISKGVEAAAKCTKRLIVLNGIKFRQIQTQQTIHKQGIGWQGNFSWQFRKLHSYWLILRNIITTLRKSNIFSIVDDIEVKIWGKPTFSFDVKIELSLYNTKEYPSHCGQIVKTKNELACRN